MTVCLPVLYLYFYFNTRAHTRFPQNIHTRHYPAERIWFLLVNGAPGSLMAKQFILFIVCRASLSLQPFHQLNTSLIGIEIASSLHTHTPPITKCFSCKDDIIPVIIKQNLTCFKGKLSCPVYFKWFTLKLQPSIFKRNFFFLQKKAIFSVLELQYNQTLESSVADISSWLLFSYLLNDQIYPISKQLKMFLLKPQVLCVTKETLE